MANHKSALKRAKQTEKRNARNRALRSALRTEIKKFRTLVDGGKKDDAQKALPLVQKTIDKACTKGVLKKNAASRAKSRLTLLLNKAAS